MKNPNYLKMKHLKLFHQWESNNYYTFDKSRLGQIFYSTFDKVSISSFGIENLKHKIGNQQKQMMRLQFFWFFYKICKNNL